MLIIPFELEEGSARGPVVVVVILEKENLDRMREADPLDVRFAAYAGRIALHRPIRDLDFVIAYEEDTHMLVEFAAKRDIKGLVRWLERGRTIKPGDLHAPVPLRKT